MLFRSKKIVSFALSQAQSEIKDYLPIDIIKTHALMPLSLAKRQIHQPDSLDSALNARRRLTFDELLVLSCGLASLKDRRLAKITT